MCLDRVPSVTRAAPSNQTLRDVENSLPEEPYALIAHVRIRGGLGRETALGYPTQLFAREFQVCLVAEGPRVLAIFSRNDDVVVVIATPQEIQQVRRIRGG